MQNDIEEARLQQKKKSRLTFVLIGLPILLIVAWELFQLISDLFGI